MKIFEEPITMLLAGFILAVAFFAIQLFLCFKAKRSSVKRIPLYIVLLIVGFALLICTRIFGTGSGFLGNANLIVAAILAIIVAIASIGIVFAWVVYKINKKHKA